MIIKKEIEKRSYAVKFSVEDEGKTVGTVRLYIMYNEVHTEPFGFLEYVLVDENYRGKGLGKKLVDSVIEEAKKLGCYKLILTCSNKELYGWYKSFGFEERGSGFRMNFK